MFGDIIIARSRFQQPNAPTGKRLRINHQIRSATVRLINEENEQLGVLNIDDAKQTAREAGLDLVEVSPNSNPPVCRVMDYGKWMYQQKKKDQKARSNSKQSELKEVRLRPKIDTHDLEIKLNKAIGFLEAGHKVQFTMQFRGREMAHQDKGLESLHSIRDRLADISKVETPPRRAGRRMSMLLSPDREATSKKESGKKKAKSDAPAAQSSASSSDGSGGSGGGVGGSINIPTSAAEPAEANAEAKG